MLEKIKVSLLTMMLTFWSAAAMAQTTPGGTTGTPGGGAGAGAGAPAATDAAADGGTNWLWIIIAVAVVAALLYFLMGRGRSTRV